MKEEMHVFVAQLPEGDDPDSFVRREGGDALEAIIAAAVPWHTWRLVHAPPAVVADWLAPYADEF